MPLENVDFKLLKGESPGFPQLESLQVVDIDDWSEFVGKTGGALPSLERCPKLNCLRMSADSNMGNSFQFLKRHSIQLKNLHLVLAHPIHEFRGYLAASRGLVEISVEITSAPDVDWGLDLDFRSHSDTLKSLYLIEQKHDSTLQALDSPTLPWLSELPNLEELAICIGPSIRLGESSNFPSLKTLWLMGAWKPAGFESDPVKVNDSIWVSCKEALRSPEIPPNLRTFALDSNWGLEYPHVTSSESAFGLAEAPADVEKLSKRDFKMLYGHLRIFNRAKHVSELTINQADRRQHRPLDPRDHLRKYWKRSNNGRIFGCEYWEAKNAWW
ncbi:hypothetical protein H072_8710 [Dactylellina haptotyla CBS 200.50]|uniref:F-box domain-containing protein n=1 Tax=Dactylellina haptotyla (strain CBS 200.50) TaxID=1284197 RepID=S8BQS3_DACHA|nr:hypothetical protein H072_8710 [Dactylellina haptotyla CBS 200.50]